MKLRNKLTILFVSLLAVSFSVCFLFLNSYFKRYTVSMLAESQMENLSITGRAFRQVGTREDFEQMGTVARDAWLRYQFGLCYGFGYALIGNGRPMVNKTDYEILDLSVMDAPFLVQEVEGRQILLVRQGLEYPDGFEILSVKDITPQWNYMEQQLKGYGLLFLTVSFVSAFLVAVCCRRLLSSLEQLRRAALSIGDGKLGATVPVRSAKDEVGQVGEAFNRMSVQVEQKVEDLQLLLGAMAHEMKTPITSIVGYSDSLLHVRLPKEQLQRGLERIYEAGMRMETMSSKLLSLVGMYENEAISMESVELKQIMNRVEKQVIEAVRQKEGSCCFVCGQECVVKGDPVLLESLLFNLVQNSIRAIDRGGRIWVKADKAKTDKAKTDKAKTDRVRVIVADDGCGIPAEDLPNVTKAFFMADKSRSRSQGGSGLGLALCERIVRLHGGKLHIQSQEREGTSVTVEFPEDGLF